MAPFADVEWSAAHVGGARRTSVEGEGHSSLFGRIHVILDDVADLAGLRDLAARERPQ